MPRLTRTAQKHSRRGDGIQRLRAMIVETLLITLERLHFLDSQLAEYRADALAARAGGAGDDRFFAAAKPW
jgi:Zn-dependent protease with chaperone function